MASWAVAGFGVAAFSWALAPCLYDCVVLYRRKGRCRRIAKFLGREWDENDGGRRAEYDFLLQSFRAAQVGMGDLEMGLGGGGREVVLGKLRGNIVVAEAVVERKRAELARKKELVLELERAPVVSAAGGGGGGAGEDGEQSQEPEVRGEEEDVVAETVIHDAEEFEKVKGVDEFSESSESVGDGESIGYFDGKEDHSEDVEEPMLPKA